MVSRAQFLQLFVAVFLPMFMAAVDQTLLATATPAIAATLGGLRDTSWIAVGYLLASATIVPVYGRLGDLRGRREMLLAALGVFPLGTAACRSPRSRRGASGNCRAACRRPERRRRPICPDTCSSRSAR